MYTGGVYWGSASETVSPDVLTTGDQQIMKLQIDNTGFLSF